MATPLSAKHLSFIATMQQDTESAKWGFEALLEIPNYADFFDGLRGAGLLSPNCNPAPVSTDDGKYWSIPYWPALDYLEKCAKGASEKGDIELAQKVLAVVREVTTAVANSGGEPDNYHTFRKFAEIMGLVPLASITDAIVALVPTWLASKFDNGLVASELDSGYLRQALVSESGLDWKKALNVLTHLTALRWEGDKQPDERERRPSTIVDDYWLKELLGHHAASFARRIGRDAVDLLLSRSREILGQDRELPSSLYRPAVEDHQQNHDWQRAENAFVEASRDALIEWIDHDPSAASEYVEKLFQDEAEIVRRIAIHALNARWPILHPVYLAALRAGFLSYGHLHEAYNLLKLRFSSFTIEERDLTLAAINNLAVPQTVRESEKWRRRMQRQWLSAIAGQGSIAVDQQFGALNNDPELGPLFEHPDFSAYSEISHGPGPSPFSAPELGAFAEDGSLVGRLNGFRETDSWRGPTIRSLVGTLTEAVLNNPNAFVDLLPAMLEANIPYQYGVIEGFKRLWDADNERHRLVDWRRAWEALIEHFDALLGSREFWDVEEPLSEAALTPTRDWIVALISDFLAAGTKTDEKAFDPQFLDRSRQLISTLLERVEASGGPSNDPMTAAINSSKGKAVEALFNQALRECRLADATAKSHFAAWSRFSPIFDGEIAKCRDANYDFSTLCGAYLPNLEYLSAEWLSANVEKIFPREFEANFLSALGGLEYAPATRSSYSLLNGRGLVEHALKLNITGRHTRERIVERVALAYLWGDETLESPRFTLLFEGRWLKDLQDMADFFWNVRNQELDEAQEERIRLFLRKCFALAVSMEPLPGGLLCHLSRLIVYVRVITPEEVEWLKVLARYVGKDRFVYEFAEQLIRLAPQYPDAVAKSLEELVDTKVPSWDYDDRLKSLLLTLGKSGQRETAIRLANRMRHLRGMVEVFEQLTSNSVS